MARRIDARKVDEAIRNVEWERAQRSRMFPVGSDRQKRKLREMDVVLDVLNWCRDMTSGKRRRRRDLQERDEDLQPANLQEHRPVIVEPSIAQKPWPLRGQFRR